VAGLEEVSGLASIDGLRLINLADGSPLYDFLSSETTTDSLQQLSGLRPRPSAVENWTGFHGVVPQDIPDGTVSAFVIDLTLQQGVSLETLAENLERSGTFAGGAGDDEGALDFEHFFLRSFRNIPIAIDSGAAPAP
jgi:hypothetical protein